MREGRDARKSLRPDTTVTSGGFEVYLRQMPACCLGAFKEEVVRGGRSEGRSESFECSECAREWQVASSLDERVLQSFVVPGGLGFGGPAA